VSQTNEVGRSCSYEGANEASDGMLSSPAIGWDSGDIVSLPIHHVDRDSVKLRTALIPAEVEYRRSVGGGTSLCRRQARGCAAMEATVWVLDGRVMVA
jgi:hypothetical protein